MPKESSRRGYKMSSFGEQQMLEMHSLYNALVKIAADGEKDELSVEDIKRNIRAYLVLARSATAIDTGALGRYAARRSGKYALAVWAAIITYTDQGPSVYRDY